MHAATDSPAPGRYPDAAVIALDPRFEKLVLPLAAVERLATGCRWAEGPVWFGDGRYLLWSDVPNDRIMRWDEVSGQSHVWRHASNYANGNTRDRQGRLVTCEHLGRRVTRTEHDGRITVLAGHYDGKRLNSPNDVVVKSDGSIWFTDPPFGIIGYYQGERAPQELPAAVYRICPDSGAITKVCDTIDGPNGLAFSPDESKLYVIESRARPRNIVACDVRDDGRALGEPRDQFRLGHTGHPPVGGGGLVWTEDGPIRSFRRIPAAGQGLWPFSIHLPDCRKPGRHARVSLYETRPFKGDSAGLTSLADNTHILPLSGTAPTGRRGRPRPCAAVPSTGDDPG